MKIFWHKLHPTRLLMMMPSVSFDLVYTDFNVSQLEQRKSKSRLVYRIAIYHPTKGLGGHGHLLLWSHGEECGSVGDRQIDNGDIVENRKPSRVEGNASTDYLGAVQSGGAVVTKNRSY
nr:hypothetical protein [Methylosinus sp. RM1]